MIFSAINCFSIHMYEYRDFYTKPGPFEQTFVPASSLHMKIEFNWLSGFRGEDV